MKPSRILISLLFAVCLLFASVRAAADARLSDGASKTSVELGETFVYQVVLDVQGDLPAQPNLIPPKFDGFQASNPQTSQSQGFNWVNGQMSRSLKLVVQWELAAVKSGKLTVPAPVVTAGGLRLEGTPVTIQVKRGATFQIPPTPTAGPVPGYTPQPADDSPELRGLKPDLGFPVLRLTLIVLAVLLALGLALWLALRPTKMKPVAAPPDPGGDALRGLEKLRPLLDEGRRDEYFLGVNQVLRTYFIHRLRIAKAEPTLFEVKAAARARLKMETGARADAPLDGVMDTLAAALFAKDKPGAAEVAGFADAARELVLEFERIKG